MAYTFSVVAWQGWDGRRYGGLPANPEDARGLKVLCVNPDNSGDTQQFWSFSSIHFQDWAEWWVYIGGLMTMYGLELADEPPGDDDPGEDIPWDGDDEPEEEPEEEPQPSIFRPRGPYGRRKGEKSLTVRIFNRVGKRFKR